MLLDCGLDFFCLCDVQGVGLWTGLFWLRRGVGCRTVDWIGLA
jgi:hypothetical protein